MAVTPREALREAFEAGHDAAARDAPVMELFEAWLGENFVRIEKALDPCGMAAVLDDLSMKDLSKTKMVMDWSDKS